MISCKITLVTIVLGATLVFSKPPPPQLPKATTPLPVFKFSEEYFQPEATQDDPDQQKNLNNCEKVYKNSMLCLVCKDPETTAKSEQCSYISHPEEQLDFNSKKKPDVPKKKDTLLQAQPRIAQSEESGEETSSYSSYPDSSGYYSYSSDDGDDGADGGDANDEVSSSYDTFSNNYDSPSGNYDGSSSNYDTFSGSYDSPVVSSAEYTSESERISQKAAKDHCDEVERDDMICMICKDPKTGDNYEKCSYAFKPRDKSYKYSKSNSFGYPDENVNKNNHQKRKTKKVASIRERSDDQTELEELKTAGSSNDGCREEVRDSMVCTVCKDPKTGANSENCSYSYKPDEKVYAYTASKTFGSPGDKKSSNESE